MFYIILILVLGINYIGLRIIVGSKEFSLKKYFLISVIESIIFVSIFYFLAGNQH
jgi:hypothetical protein